MACEGLLRKQDRQRSAADPRTEQIQAYKKELETKHLNLSWEWHVDVYDK